MKKMWFWGLIAGLTVGSVALTSCSSDDTPSPDTPQGPDVPVMSEITYELTPETQVVPEGTSDLFFDVDTAAGTFTMPASVAADQVPVAGQCLIVNNPTDALPNGLLAKVKRVDQTSQGYVVTYEDAQLGDAFESIDIPEQAIPLTHVVEQVIDADGNLVDYQLVKATRESGEVVDKLYLPEVGWKLPMGLELTPKMTVDMTLMYVMQFNEHKPIFVASRIDADVELAADLSVGVDGNLIDIQRPALSIICGAIPVGPIVITPVIDFYPIINVNGKVSLEASVSYKRTMHARLVYQDGHGLDAKIDVDPEEPDAWSFSFGPKLEGSISYGLGLGASVGVYGKTLAIGCTFDVKKKEAISAKFDLAALADGGWEFGQMEAPQYSSAIVAQLKGHLQLVGHDLMEVEAPEVAFPVDSRPVFPEFTIDSEKFMKKDGNKVTLTMTMTNKGLLYGKYRAEWTPIDNKNAKAIIQYFDFDDGKIAILEKDGDTDITCKATLRDDTNYELNVYYEYEQTDLNVFHKDPEAMKISMITAFGTVYGYPQEGENHDPQEFNVGGGFSRDATFTTKAQGQKLYITAVYNDGKGTVSKLECYVDNVSGIATGTAKLRDIKLSSKIDRNMGSYLIKGDWEIDVESLPMEKGSDHTWYNSCGDGMNITHYHSTSTTSGLNGEYASTVHMNLYPSDLNDLQINIYFDK
ncbi:MAG: hypothetical protein IJ064_02555 [Bacteroidaceae bacterium]|nr:hypothetical protein [Bacteroidaceae bacterium]